MSTLQKAYIALGANVGKPEQTFFRAIELISAHVGEVASVSRFYNAAPLLHPSNSSPQPEYLNAVLCCYSSHTPQKLLNHLLDIEDTLGRKKSPGLFWAPRVIDLDLLAVDQLIVHTEFLELPHYLMHKRDFVLFPLYEIEPNFYHPLLKKSVFDMIQDFEQSGIAPTLSERLRQRILRTASNM